MIKPKQTGGDHYVRFSCRNVSCRLQIYEFHTRADALNLTQPAVSQHIKYLENRYHAPLFLRENKKLTLTPAGEILRSALETMRNDETTIEERMKESLSAKKSSDLRRHNDDRRICIVPALSKFVKLHPDTDFHIRYGNTQTLLSALHEGTIDFAIVEGYFQKEMYETRVYRTEEYIAVASGNHHFTKSFAHFPI